MTCGAKNAAPRTMDATMDATHSAPEDATTTDSGGRLPTFVATHVAPDGWHILATHFETR